MYIIIYIHAFLNILKQKAEFHPCNYNRFYIINVLPPNHSKRTSVMGFVLYLRRKQNSNEEIKIQNRFKKGIVNDFIL